MNWQPPTTDREKQLQAEIDALRASQTPPPGTGTAPPPAADVPPPDVPAPSPPTEPALGTPPEPAPEPAPSEARPAFYCPACGRALHVQIECVGRSAEAPHPPVEAVSSDELDGPADKLTPAPSVE